MAVIFYLSGTGNSLYAAKSTRRNWSSAGWKALPVI